MEQEKQVSGQPPTNHCGSCTLCCKLLGVQDLPQPKQPNEWCSHCAVGIGCTIYNLRPDSCRDYECVWLTWKNAGNEIDDRLRPDRSKVIVDMDVTNEKRHYVHVDPSRKEAWRDPLVQGMLMMLAQQGSEIYLSTGKEKEGETGLKLSIQRRIPLPMPANLVVRPPNKLK